MKNLTLQKETLRTLSACELREHEAGFVSLYWAIRLQHARTMSQVETRPENPEPTSFPTPNSGLPGDCESDGC